MLVVKNLPANAGDERDVGPVPGLGRSPGGGNGNSLHYSCLEDPIDRGVRRAAVHEVTKDSDTTEHARSSPCPHTVWFHVYKVQKQAKLNCITWGFKGK